MRLLIGHDRELVRLAARRGVLPGLAGLTPVLHHGAACSSFARPAGACDCRGLELRVGDVRLRFADVVAVTGGTP